MIRFRSWGLPLWTRPLLAGRSFFDLEATGCCGLRFAGAWTSCARSRPSAENFVSPALAIAHSPFYSCHAAVIKAVAILHLPAILSSVAQSGTTLQSLSNAIAKIFSFGAAAEKRVMYDLNLR
jgi:hypothetical protein